MRWNKDGWKTCYACAAVAENADRAAYDGYHQEQRHQRLYGRPPVAAQDAWENQALAGLEPPAQTRSARCAFIMPIIVAPRR